MLSNIGLTRSSLDINWWMLLVPAFCLHGLLFLVGLPCFIYVFPDYWFKYDIIVGGKGSQSVFSSHKPRYRYHLMFLIIQVLNVPAFLVSLFHVDNPLIASFQ